MEYPQDKSRSRTKKGKPPAAISEVTLDGRHREAGPNMFTLRQQLDERMGGLRTDRYSWWVHWRELADYILPRRYRWLITPNQATRGTPINQRIIDSTPTIALRVMAAGMMAGLTSPGRPWFRMTLDNTDLAEYYPVKVWLEEVRRRMLTVFAESNFYNAIATMYTDLGCFGTAPVIIYEDREDVIRCYNSCAGEYYVANGPRMNVDTMFREFTLSAAQIMRRFGEQNCSATVKQAKITKGAALSRESIICHGIEPNDNLAAGTPIKNFPWRETYWEYGQNDPSYLRMRGFHECPFIAPRWDVSGNDAYGRCPAMDALGDVKQLQVETKRKAQAIDKMVNPPMVADVALKNEPASMLPGGITYVNNVANTAGFKPAYEVKPDLQYMVEDIKEVQARVKATFFNDLFMMISQLDTVRTATEIDARREEKIIQLGPVVERTQNEALDPAIDRVFNVMLRAGLLPPPPQEMRGQRIKVEYISILAQTQKAVMTAGVERFAAFVGNIAAVKPEVLDNVDFDEMVDEYADMLGVSPKVIVPYAKVLQMRMQRQQQQQAQEMAQAAQVLPDAAKTLSETQLGGGVNALQLMVGDPRQQMAANS